MSERRDIILVCDEVADGDGDGVGGGDARRARRLSELFTARGHSVRLVDIGGRRVVRKLGEIFRSARPGGVVIAAGVEAMERVGRSDTAALKVIAIHAGSTAAAGESPEHPRMLRNFAQADRFIALTGEDADLWARAGLSNADALPDALGALPAGQSSYTEQVVLGPSRLTHAKGVDMLMESWALIAPQNPSWRLRFPSSTADQETTFGQASIFALPSRDEGVPVDLLAAMAYGLPAVAFDCAPGVREIITNEVDGLLIQPGHTEQFAFALGRLIEDEELRHKLGRAARESVRSLIPEHIGARWERLFALLYR